MLTFDNIPFLMRTILNMKIGVSCHELETLLGKDKMNGAISK